MRNKQKERDMGFVVIGLIVVGVIAVVGGGNTFHGFGDDVRATSDKISEESK